MQVNNKNDLLPFSKKYPRLFVLKKSILILVLLIGIIGIADALMYVHIINNPDPTANASFVNDIIVSSRIEGLTGEKIGYLIRNMLKANPEAYFEKSTVIMQETYRLTPKVIKSVFETHSKNILFIFSISVNTTVSQFSIFIPSSFSIPTNNSDPIYNETIEYFTFEYENVQSSVILAMEREGYLNMNQSWFASDEKIRPVDCILCKTYLLAETQNVFFKILGILGFVNESDKIHMDFAENMFHCFGGMSENSELEEKISHILNMDDVSEGMVEIKEIEAYYLHN